jgi:chromosome segregation ATPase
LFGVAGERIVDLKRERNSDDRNGDIGVAFAAVHTPPAASTKEKSDEEKLSLFWRLFGGTVLSIAALVAITVYNNMASNISELRAEIGRINDARSELIKKDDLNARLATLSEQAKSLQSQGAAQTGTLTALQAGHAELRDRLAAIKGEAETARKDGATAIDAARKEFGGLLETIRKDQTAINDQLKKDIAAIEVIREKLTAIDAVKKELDAVRKDLASVEALRDKLAMIATEIKDHRDDIGKLRQEVERNLAGDAERKKSRDDQYAKLLDAMKELDKAARAAGEKIARIEGTIAPMPMPPAKPTPKPAVEKPKGGDPE